jgi:hypothetical protein
MSSSLKAGNVPTHDQYAILPRHFLCPVVPANPTADRANLGIFECRVGGSVDHHLIAAANQSSSRIFVTAQEGGPGAALEIVHAVKLASSTEDLAVRIGMASPVA